MNAIPNLFCLGAQKAGTTALSEILKQSNDIFISEKKEIHYFDIPENYSLGSKWYIDQFEEGNNKKYRADFTPDYLIYDFVPERLQEFCNSETKFIVMLRNPIDRAYSQFQFFKSFDAEHRDSYTEAFQSDLLASKKVTFSTIFDPKHYIERGHYKKQIDRYLNYFDKKQFKFILYEKFKESPQLVINEICEFLEIEYFEFRQVIANQTRVSYSKTLSDTIRSKHPAKKMIVNFLRKVVPISLYNRIKMKIYYSIFKPPIRMNSKDRKKIFMQYYANEIEELETLTGLDLSLWEQSL